jgi:hypothetical protein
VQIPSIRGNMSIFKKKVEIVKAEPSQEYKDLVQNMASLTKSMEKFIVSSSSSFEVLSVKLTRMIMALESSVRYEDERKFKQEKFDLDHKPTEKDLLY